MSLQVALKKSFCIDSKIVNKIDSQGNVIYSCYADKNSDFSTYFYEKIAKIEAELLYLEAAFAVSGVQKIKPIDVDENDLSEGINQLSKKLFKKTLIQLYQIEDDLFLELTASFALQEKNSNSLLGKIFNESMKEIGFYKSVDLKKRISKKMVSLLLDKERSVFEKLIVVSSEDVNLERQLRQKLSRLGYISNGEISNLRLDLVLELDIQDKELEKEVFRIGKLAQYKIGIKTPDRFILMPSEVELSQDAYQNIFVRNRVIIGRSKRFSFNNLDMFSKNTEKITALYYETKNVPIKWDALILDINLKQFFYKNPKIEFVQIFIPAYELKKTALKKYGNFFKYAASYSKLKTKYQLLGWEENEWLKDAKAYRPIAAHEVIQLYRIGQQRN